VKRHLADLDARERVPHHATCYLRWSDGTFVPS
jgi:hypothetical protein